MRSRISSAIVRTADPQQLIDKACRIAVDVGGCHLAWVGYAGDDRIIVPHSHAGGKDQAPPATDGGPPGRAIQSGEPVFISDLETGGDTRPWREFARTHGCRGMLCLPLKEQARAFGVWVLYPPGERPLSAEELQLLRELADDLAFGIAHLRANLARRRIDEAVRSMARDVCSGTGSGFFEKLIFRAAEALDASAGFIVRLNADETRASAIGAVVNGKPVSGVEFSLAGTPCERLMNADVRLIPENVHALYPHAPAPFRKDIEAFAGTRLLDASGQSIGLMFLLFPQPLAQPESISSTLTIFAARAAGELVRRQSDALLHERAALLDKAQDAILVHDFEHRISFWNRSAERLYGWSAAEAVGHLASQLIHHDHAALGVAIETTLTKGEWVGEIAQTTKAGEALTVEARWALVRDEQGNPKSILSINTDITGRKKLEQQFLRAQRMESIGTLAGGIAHDINNVLSPIMMSIDLLQNYITDPDGLNILHMVGASARRGAEMVRQVLSFARGAEEGHAGEIQVAPIVDDLLRIIEETFPKHIRIETRLQPDLWPIKGDPTQIHQVLLNLCLNARDAMPGGGRLTLKVQNLLFDEQQAATHIEAHPGPYLTIEIGDTGHGIPKEILEKIFDPFFTTKEMGMGTGLGLSSTLAIMKSHGGFVHTFSEPGAGTRFRLYLPAMTEPGWASVDAPAADLPRGRGETVMVVDDEVFVRRITMQTLEAFGYKVLLAANGSEAVSTYVGRQNEIAVVLTDMMMPVMDGPATIRMLRHLNPFVRIIGATGFNASGKVASATNAGVKHFLQKPYTAETLLKAIRKALAEQP